MEKNSDGYPFHFRFYICVQIFITIERIVKILFLFWVNGPPKQVWVSLNFEMKQIPTVSTKLIWLTVLSIMFFFQMANLHCFIFKFAVSEKLYVRVQSKWNSNPQYVWGWLQHLLSMIYTENKCHVIPSFQACGLWKKDNEKMWCRKTNPNFIVLTHSCPLVFSLTYQCFYAPFACN